MDANVNVEVEIDEDDGRISFNFTGTALTMLKLAAQASGLSEGEVVRLAVKGICDPIFNEIQTKSGTIESGTEMSADTRRAVRQRLGL